MKQVLSLLMIMILGIGIGLLGFLLFGNMAASTGILYLSQEEILKLEKDRLAAKDDSSNRYGNNQHSGNNHVNANLFFDQIDLAIELLKSEALKYQDKRNKVIFITSGLIIGEEVTSISQQVYLSVIERLEKVPGSQQQAKLENKNANDDNLEGIKIFKDQILPNQTIKQQERQNQRNKQNNQ